MATEFGVLVKDMRIKKRLTLRKFCQELELDPSNWSKIERGINPPPRDETVLSGWADFFGLEGIFRQEFLDAGAIARQEIPADMINDEALRAKLPAFFRAMRGQEPDEAQLNELVDEIRKINSTDKDA